MTNYESEAVAWLDEHHNSFGAGNNHETDENAHLFAIADKISSGLAAQAYATLALTEAVIEVRETLTYIAEGVSPSSAKQVKKMLERVLGAPEESPEQND